MRRFAVVALSVLIAFVVVAMALPLFRGSRGSRINVCGSHVKSLALAMYMYADDYDGHFPASAAWCDALCAYVRDLDTFHCDKAPSLPCGYAYNSHMPTISLKQLSDPGRTVVIFESARGWNAAGGIELLPSEPRHHDGDYYGFADGSATWVKRSEASVLIWNPVPSAQSQVPSP